MGKQNSVFMGLDTELSVGVNPENKTYVGVSMASTDMRNKFYGYFLSVILSKQEAISLAHDLLAMAESIKEK